MYATYWRTCGNAAAVWRARVTRLELRRVGVSRIMQRLAHNNIFSYVTLCQQQHIFLHAAAVLWRLFRLQHGGTLTVTRVR